MGGEGSVLPICTRFSLGPSDYSICPEPLDFAAAAADCIRRGATLAVIGSEAEDEFVAASAAGVVDDDSWLGGTRDDSYVWRWADNTIFWRGGPDGAPPGTMPSPMAPRRANDSSTVTNEPERAGLSSTTKATGTIAPAPSSCLRMRASGSAPDSLQPAQLRPESSLASGPRTGRAVDRSDVALLRAKCVICAITNNRRQIGEGIGRSACSADHRVDVGDGRSGEELESEYASLRGDGLTLPHAGIGRSARGRRRIRQGARRLQRPSGCLRHSILFSLLTVLCSVRKARLRPEHGVRLVGPFWFRTQAECIGVCPSR